MKNANDENIVHSISSTVPTISLRFCSDCLSDKYLAVAVNYNVKDVVEYFAFVICTNCNYESEGGGIFSDYRDTVQSAQEFWNSSKSEKPDEPKN